jgi:hypothetical protein
MGMFPVVSFEANNTNHWQGALTGWGNGQSFTTPSTGFSCTHIEIEVQAWGTRADGLFIELWSTAGGVASTKLATSAIIPHSEFILNPAWEWKAFKFPAPVALSASTLYFFAVKCSTTLADNSNMWGVRANTQTAYAGGGRCLINSNGTNDAISTSVDLTFRISVEGSGAYVSGLGTLSPPVGPFKCPIAIGGMVNTATGATTSWGAPSLPPRLGQYFTSDASATPITAVGFRVGSLAGNPTDGLRVDIYEVDVSNKPTGPSLATSAVIPSASLLGVASASFTMFALNFTPAANTKYAAVLARTGAQDSGNYYGISVTASSVVANSSYISETSLPSWSVDLNKDCCFIISRDGYYIFGRDLTTTTTLQAFKATDPTVSWASIATKTGFTTSILYVTGYQVSNIIHLVVTDGTNATLQATKYLSFDTATETFLATIETVAAASNRAPLNVNSPLTCPASLVVRPYGEVVAFFNGTQVKSSGSFYCRVYYSRRTAVNTWTAPVQVDMSLASDNFSCGAVLAADSSSVHFTWGVYAQNLLQRTLSATNVLQTVSTALVGYATPSLGAATRGVSYLRGGTTKVAVSTLIHATFAGSIARFDSANVPTLTGSGTAITTGVSTPGHMRPYNDDTDLYALFFGGLSTSDIYVNKSTDDGATWGTATIAGNYTTASADERLSIDAKPYQRGTRVVLPYVVLDTGNVWKYNEYTPRYVNPLISQRSLTSPNSTMIYGGGQSNDTYTELVAQGFTVPTSKQWAIEGVLLFLGRQGAPVDTLFAEIRRDTPDGALVATSINSIVSGDTIGVGGETWVNLAFATPTLTAGVYYLVVQRSGAFSSSNYFGLRIEQVETYTGGKLWERHSTSGWRIAGTGASDLAFELGGVETLLSTDDAWNIKDKSTSITLSGGDKTATSTVVAAADVRSTTSRKQGVAGKYYAEFVFSTNPQSMWGLLPTASALGGSQPVHAAVDITSGGVYISNVSAGVSLGAGSITDINSIAWDTLAELVWFRRNDFTWNGNASADPATGVGGISTAALPDADFALWWRSNTISGSAVTIRTEKAEFTQTTPVGYSSWMGEELAAPGWPVTSLIGASPVFSVPAFAQVHILPPALPINLSVPVSAPFPLVQMHVLTAGDLVDSSPVFGTLLFKQMVPLAAPSLIVAPYVMGVPSSMTQVHKIVALTLAPLWSYVPSAIVQAHTLTATAAVAGAPAVNASSILLVVPMFASNLVTSAPVIATVDATIRIALATSSFATSGIGFGTAVIHEINLLSAANLATGPPVEATASIKQQHAIAAIAFAAPTPAIGTPTLAQVHPCVAVGHVNVAPAIAAAVLTQAHKINPATITPAAPIVGGTSINQQQVLPAPVSFVATPVIPIGFLGQAGVFTPLPTSAGVPTIGVSSLAQVHKLTAPAFPFASPSIGQGAYGRVITSTSLTVSIPSVGATILTLTIDASDFVVPAPAIGTPTLTKTLTPANVAAGLPTFAAAALKQVHALATAPFIVAAPVFDDVYLGQAGVFAVVPLSAGDPVIGTPAFNQRCAFTTAALAVPAPSIGLGVYGHVITALPLAVPAPSFTDPAPLRKVLTPAGFAAGAPVLGTSAVTKALVALDLAPVPAIAVAQFKQAHALAGTPAIVTSPSYSPVVLGQAGVMQFMPLVAGLPAFTIPLLKQGHALAAPGTADAVPTIGESTIAQAHKLTLAFAPVAAPVLGTWAIVQEHRLTAALAPVAPVLAVAVLRQANILAAAGVTVATPIVNLTTFGQGHLCSTLGIATSAPNTGLPPLLRKVLQAEAFAVSAPVIEAPLSTGVLPAAPPIKAGAPALGTPAMVVIAGIGMPVLWIGPPVIGVPLFKQVHKLAQPVAIAAGAPTLSSPSFKAPEILTAPSLTIGTPVFSRPAMQGWAGLVPVSLTVVPIAPPTLTLGVRVHLAALGLAIGAPASTVPAIGQEHELSTWRIMPIPELGEAQLGQVHSLAAGDLVSGRPFIRTAFISQAGVMAAVPLWISAPELGEASPRQRHALDAIGVAAGAPSLGRPAVGVSVKLPRAQSTFAGRFRPLPAALGQVHQLTALAVILGPPRALPATLKASARLGLPAPAVAGSPALGAPLMRAMSRLVPVGLRYNYPSLGGPQLAQEHVLAARDLAISGPLFQGIAVRFPGEALGPIGIETAAPVLGSPRLSHRARLYAVATIAGQRGNRAVITGTRHRNAV